MQIALKIALLLNRTGKKKSHANVKIIINVVTRYSLTKMLDLMTARAGMQMRAGRTTPVGKLLFKVIKH